MLANLLQRFAPAHRPRTGAFTLPGLVVEMQPEFVVGARLVASVRSRRRCDRLAVADLEPGSLQALLSRSNISSQSELHRAVRRLAEVVGNGNSRLGLLIPDAAARVAMLTFEALPDNAKEADALLAWRVKDLLPFPPEEARLSYQVLRRATDSIELLVVAARSAVLAEYESALEPMQGGPVLILPSTMALLPLVPDSAPGAQLVIHFCSGSVTAVVLAAGGVRLWRTRPVGATTTGDLAGEIAAEIDRVTASTRDSLALDIERIWLCARPPATSELAGQLAAQLSRQVDRLVPDPELASTLSDPERALFERFGASVAGLVANGN